MEKIQVSRDAFEASIRHDRPRLIQAWIFLALFLGPFFLFAPVHPDLDRVDIWICLAALLAMAFNIIFLPRNNLYQRYFLLVIAAVCAICLWVANALLGGGQDGLAADRLPWITPLIAVAVIYVHCFQSTEDADRAALLMGLAVAVLLGLHFGLDRRPWTVSGVWMLLFCTLGLLQVRLALWLQVLVHNAMHERLSLELHAREQRLRELQDEIEALDTGSAP